jgi:sensor c-di-GMP phosphodiesterase-like protein
MLIVKKRHDNITIKDVRNAINNMTVNGVKIEIDLTDEECLDIVNTSIKNLKAAREKGLDIKITEVAIHSGLRLLFYDLYKDRIEEKYPNLK